MTIKLSAEDEALVRSLMNGQDCTPEDIVRAALEWLAADVESFEEYKALIEEKLQRSFAQVERGESLTPEEVREYMERRKEAWRKERRRA